MEVGARAFSSTYFSPSRQVNKHGLNDMHVTLMFDPCILMLLATQLLAQLCWNWIYIYLNLVCS